MNKKQRTWIFIAVVGIAAALLLKTVWWPMDKVLTQVALIEEALVTETTGGQLYLEEDDVQALAALLSGAELRFDRKSDTFTHDAEGPSYDLMLSGDGFSYGAIFFSGERLHYNNTTYYLREADAAALHELLAGCFS